MDAAGAGETAVPAVALVVLRPRNLFGLDVLLEARQSARVRRMVEADTDEFDAPVPIFGVQPLYFRHLGDAGPAPGGPEVDDDDLPLERLDRDGRAADGVSELELERFADSLGPIADPLESCVQSEYLETP